jgi:hypothetical protein
MLWISRPAILTDVRAKAALFGVLLAGLVAVLAQRLQLAEPERIPVTTMGLDVVGDESWDDEALLQTMRAQRMGAKLGMGAMLPTTQAVPVPWISRVQHGLHGLMLGWRMESRQLQSGLHFFCDRDSVAANDRV